jgi:predicted AAA+ superfamily ATPase
MKRKAIQELINWKNKTGKKPMIIQGARQVGKTWLMQEFGRLHYKQTVYINFDNNDRMRDSFNVDLDVKRLVSSLELEAGFKIAPENTLIIFDEIQECPRALTSLKYFNENAPQYNIVAAGSLLGVAHHSGTGFPVGKVEFMNLYPLSFEEFAEALGKERFIGLTKKKDFQMIATFKSSFLELLRQYCYIGGMPAVVQHFVDNSDFNAVREIQLQIIEAYEKDFSKHIPANTVAKIRLLWKSIPAQLTKENKKFIYGIIKEGARAKEFETALAWLRDCGLIYKVHKIKKPALPVVAYEDFYAFKLFILDVGLLGALTNLEAVTMIEGNKIFEEFKGAIAEQYVLQQLKTIKHLPVFYWTNDTSRSEIDFIIQLGSNVVPVEVKSSTNLKAKSLKNYREEFKPGISIRTSTADYKETDKLYDIPLYMIENVEELVITQ